MTVTQKNRHLNLIQRTLPLIPKYSESYPELNLENSDVELQKIINASNQRILKVQDNLIPCP